MSKTPSERLVTPVGTAAFPHIAEPDTKGEFATGKYSLQVEYGDETAAELLDQLRAAAERLLPGVKSPKLPVKNNGALIFKSKYKPVVVDAQNNTLPEDFKLRSGSKVRVIANLAPYKNPGVGQGITAHLSAVQVVESAERGSGFEAVEGGYVHASRGVNDDVPF
jgi:hypothetical protein